MKNAENFYKITTVIFAICAVVFTSSFAFSEYLEIKANNIQAISTWNACIQNSNLGDRAYEFCRSKCSENYMFKTPFEWGEFAGIPDGDE
jgi:hypothetical protein